MCEAPAPLQPMTQIPLDRNSFTVMPLLRWCTFWWWCLISKAHTWLGRMAGCLTWVKTRSCQMSSNPEHTILIFERTFMMFVCFVFGSYFHRLILLISLLNYSSSWTSLIMKSSACCLSLARGFTCFRLQTLNLLRQLFSFQKTWTDGLATSSLPLPWC